MLLCAVGSGAALAKTGSINPPLPKEISDMECLVGNWKGTGRVTMAGQAADVKLTWACKRTPGGHGVGLSLIHI